MILDTLSNAETYLAIHPGFEKAFAFLRRADVGSLGPGKYSIDAAEVFALIQKDPGRLRTDSHLEAHKNHIDIQFLIEGDEQIGWITRNDCKDSKQPYVAERDIEYFEDPPQTYLSLKPDMFAVFFPGDAHAPMISDGLVHKCVVKVKVSEP